MDELDFLDSPEGEPIATPAIEPEAQAPEAQPTDAGPPRDERGRFAPVQGLETAAEPPAGPAPQEPPAPAVPPGYVPVSALQELRQEIRQLKQAPRPPEQVPDRYDDPEGYEAYREQQVEQRLLNQTLNVSERFARKEHGAETVDKARDWALAKFQSDPLYYQRVMSDADPYEAVVQDWKREQVLSSMKDGDLDAFLAWKAGQAPPQVPQAAPPGAPPVPTPPRSLASAPSAGGAKPGEEPVGPGAAFDALFK